MEKTADAVVIGGGIMGASAAHFLAKKGFGKIVLLEKRRLAAVSTGHSAAVVRTFYSNSLTIKLALRALQMFENDLDELGGDTNFRQIGYLCLLGERTAEAGRQVMQLEQNLGAEAVELSPDEVSKIMPQLNIDDLVGGILEPRSGYVDPTQTTQILVNRAAGWGLRAYEDIGVTAIRLAGNRVAGVETERGAIDAPVVINAAGPWGRQLGLSIGLNYSLRWSRESDLILRMPADFKQFPVISDPNLRIYLRPDGNDNLLAGLGAPKDVEPLDIDDYDPNLDPKTRRRIEQGIFKRVPALQQAGYVNGWASIYTVTDDWHPLVGPEPELEGYYAFFGGSGHGFKLGPPLGEALSDIITGRTPAIDIRPLRPNRFAEGEVFTSAWGGGNRA